MEMTPRIEGEAKAMVRTGQLGHHLSSSPLPHRERVRVRGI
jgi:hypothetical protein